ncbi:hypothetical protein CRG98_044145 [Punica granatum]|uniref:Uncharacterized protein n=1 Tax=Punica granatum TaxID=22663 RepID=A0A2I0HUS7_PUNGR|nr:hypothetical protein CRG98_044145 [Punica granatum]
MVEKRQLLIGSTDELCPRVKKKVEEARELSRHCAIVYAEESKFQVVDLGEGFCCGEIEGKIKGMRRRLLARRGEEMGAKIAEEKSWRGPQEEEISGTLEE